MTTKSLFAGGLKALVFASASAALGAHATDYYVSTSGNDSNSGSSSQPFRTITHAYTYAATGVTIHVAPGIYTDYTSGWGIHLGKSGTASSPIVLRSDVQGGAIIDGQNASDRNEGFYIDGDYNVVDGFEIRNAPNGGISIWSNGNQILRNHIHNNGNPASNSTNGKDGVYSDQTTSGNVYIANYIDHNGRTGSNLDHGLYLCGKNEVILNNLLLANAASGLQVAGYTTVSNMKVYNNVMAWNGTSGIILWQSLSGVDIKNNIIYQNGHYGIGSYQASGSGVVVNNNVSYGNGYGDFDWTGGSSTYSYSQAGNMLSDPGLVNESVSAFDAHLATGSPCIRSGLNLSSTFTTDMAGAVRPSSGAWDLGVFAFGSSDLTPPTVSLTAPASGATVAGSAVIVSANASDNVGVAGVQFKLDGANLGAEVSTAPYNVSWNTTNSANGSHTLSAVARDAAGNLATNSISVTVSNSVPVAAVITVAATTPNASRVGPASGVFTVSRTGGLTSALAVNLAFGGTATNNQDYLALGATVTIPAGAASAAVTVTPMPSTVLCGARTVVLTLTSGSGYSVGAANSATITIAGNDMPCSIAKAPSNNVKITWPSVSGKIYRVAAKNNLTDPAWTNLSSLITATGTSTSYTDTAASTKSQRFYVVYLTN